MAVFPLYLVLAHDIDRPHNVFADQSSVLVRSVVLNWYYTTMTDSRLRFLIVGAGRGGTSLLMGLLDAHSRLEVGLERHTVECLMGHGLGVPTADIRKDLAQVRSAQFRAACDNDAAQHPAVAWGNKITTEQIYGLEDQNFANPGQVDVLKILFEGYLSDVIVIFILRDGRTCVRSKLARTTQQLAHACARWRYSVQVMDYLERYHANTVTVRYEELVKNPQTVLRNLCDVLDVEFEPNMLAGVANEKLPDEYRSDRISKASLSFAGAPVLAFPLLMDELRRLGYISPARFWMGRLTYSRWSPLLFLVVGAIAVMSVQSFLG